LKRQSNERGVRPNSCLYPSSSVSSIKVVEADIEPAISVDRRVSGAKPDKSLYKPLTYQDILYKNKISSLKESNTKENVRLSDFISPPKRTKSISISSNLSTSRVYKNANGGIYKLIVYRQ
jgi:hypothetical protein